MNGNKLQNSLIQQFQTHKETFEKTSTPSFFENKMEAIAVFTELGFPHQKLEAWRHTKFEPITQFDYQYDIFPTHKNYDIEKLFQCEITEMDALVVSQVNGWVSVKNERLTQLKNGVILGSLAAAMQAFPEIVDKHISKYANFKDNSLVALNTAMATDGLFVYIPDNIELQKPVQLINIIHSHDNLMVQPRNLVILGKNSKLTLVHCDHSLTHNVSFINSVTEVFLDQHAQIDHYKMQNKGNTSALITNTYFHQEANSQVSSNTLTLNGGFIRNNIQVSFAGKHSEANLYGLYLVDGNQFCDNNLYVQHHVPDCNSNQFYKGILDNKAKAVFSGKVLVDKDAQRTNAFQSNKNILLTDEATINTKPHLEIYADDVKCSHGATVGQLDAEALFYLKSRGISEENARMLLMSAFAAEIIQKISIPSLKDRIDYLVDKRLKGELSICDQCILNCKSNQPVVFQIDTSKI